MTNILTISLICACAISLIFAIIALILSINSTIAVKRLDIPKEVEVPIAPPKDNSWVMTDEEMDTLNEIANNDEDLEHII